MRDQAVPDISVILAVGEAEETVGHRVRALAAHLRALRLRFEIIAVNDGSFDNSFPVLVLLAGRIPEMRFLSADSSGRAFARGIGEARAPIVALMDAGCPLPLGPLGWALGRIAGGREAVILRGRYIVARRLPVLPVVLRAGGRFPGFERSFERHATRLGIDIVGTRPRARPRGLLAPVLRLLAA